MIWSKIIGLITWLINFYAPERWIKNVVFKFWSKSRGLNHSVQKDESLISKVIFLYSTARHQVLRICFEAKNILNIILTPNVYFHFVCLSYNEDLWLSGHVNTECVIRIVFSLLSLFHILENIDYRLILKIHTWTVKITCKK